MNVTDLGAKAIMVALVKDIRNRWQASNDLFRRELADAQAVCPHDWSVQWTGCGSEYEQECEICGLTQN